MVLNTVLGSTGYAASRAIRALKRPDANVPIIALTADALEESTREAAAAGMDGHLAKPVNPKKLYALLARVVGKENNRSGLWRGRPVLGRPFGLRFGGDAPSSPPKCTRHARGRGC